MEGQVHQVSKDYEQSVNGNEQHSGVKAYQTVGCRNARDCLGYFVCKCANCEKKSEAAKGNATVEPGVGCDCAATADFP